MSNKVKISNAAIMLADGKILSLPRPARHNDIFGEAWFKENLVGHEQGFTTNKGEFVDRREALLIAMSSGQLIRSPMVAGKLHTEDLW